MSTPLAVLEAEILSLSADERSRLLDRLIASLDNDPDIQEAWIQEATRRAAEIDSGEAKLIPGEQVLAELRSRLK